MAAFLDLRGSFNNVRVDSISESLLRHEVHEELVFCIANIFKTWTFQSDLGCNKGSKRIGIEAPCSVLPYLLYRFWWSMPYFVIKNQQRHVSLLRKHGNPGTGVMLSTINPVWEEFLGKKHIWVNTWELNVNLSKTDIMIFTIKMTLTSFLGIFL